MRILLLEDSIERIVWFRRRFQQHTLDVTDKPTRAIWWLQKHEYDLIFLDHDLREDHYTIMAHDTILDASGMVVAQWLAERPDAQPNATIVVHSLNPVSAPEMYARLRCEQRSARVFRIPFPVLKAKLTHEEDDLRSHH